MTRINVGVDPRLLTDEHLLAEHREIKRICNRVTKRCGNTNGAPDKFTLGAGHELFFLRYGEFTYNRYLQLRNECKRRGFNVSDYSDNWKCYDQFPELFNDFTPTIIDISKIVDRIASRITDSPKDYFHYCGCRMSKEEAIDRITSILLI